YRRRGGLRVPPRRRTHPQPPVLLGGARRHLPPLDVTPPRDQQLPGQRHHADLPCPLVPRAEAPPGPLAQGTARLPAPPPPGQLPEQAAHLFVARGPDPLLPSPLAAVVGHRRQADQRSQLLAVLEAPPGEQLGDQNPGAAHAHGLEPPPPPHLLPVRLRPLPQLSLLLIGRVAHVPVQRLPHRKLLQPP